MTTVLPGEKGSCRVTHSEKLDYGKYVTSQRDIRRIKRNVVKSYLRHLPWGLDMAESLL
jgi:hypothetical protein